MAEVAEVKEIEHVEKDAEKKVVKGEEDKIENKKEKDSKPKENGKSEANEKKEPETNGSTESGENAATGAAAKRKSGAGDVVDETPTEGATPEKKAKISADENDSTNGESEVVATEGANDAKNSSYQKHF